MIIWCCFRPSRDRNFGHLNVRTITHRLEQISQLEQYSQNLGTNFSLKRESFIINSIKPGVKLSSTNQTYSRFPIMLLSTTNQSLVTITLSSLKTSHIDVMLRPFYHTVIECHRTNVPFYFTMFVLDKMDAVYQRLTIARGHSRVTRDFLRGCYWSINAKTTDRGNTVPAQSHGIQVNICNRIYVNSVNGSRENRRFIPSKTARDAALSRRVVNRENRRRGATTADCANTPPITYTHHRLSIDAKT